MMMKITFTALLGFTICSASHEHVDCSAEDASPLCCDEGYFRLGVGPTCGSKKESTKFAIGSLSVLTIRVTGQDASAPKTSKKELQDMMIDVGTWYKRCSQDQFSFVPFMTTVGNLNVESGVAELELPVNMLDYRVEQIEDKVYDELMRLSGKNLKDIGYDRLVICLPYGTRYNIRTAWAMHADQKGYPSRVMANDGLDSTCRMTGKVIHELGHTLNLHHSNYYHINDPEIGVEYGDRTGLMGNAGHKFQLPQKCFNAVNLWNLQWYQEHHVSLSCTGLTDGNPKTITKTLIGFSEVHKATTTTEDVAVIIEILASDAKYYVSLNRKFGINNDVVQHADEVVIYKWKGLLKDGQDNGSVLMYNLTDLVLDGKTTWSSGQGWSITLSGISLLHDPAMARVGISCSNTPMPKELNWMSAPSVKELTITGTLTWFEAHEYAVSNGYELPTRDDLKNSGVRPERGINTDEWQPVRRVDSIEGDYVNVGTWNGDSNYISHLDEERIDTLPLWGNTNTAAVYRSSTYMFVTGLVSSVKELTITGTLTWFEAHEYAVSNGYELPTRDDLKNSGVRPERGINTDEWQPVRRVDSIEGDYVNVGTWVGDSNYISHLDEERIDTLPLW
eukprot:CAMPEP_0194346500 /NCGR_PEP_ID=MMETSP0171-20130528/105460_1 /TAXON_ID=218684 /ORGANISM="Corethron pennatum, Strain L29A3" /LENGTH=617 /DNA_ID=CAMNT_0039113631 /DNA_START=99 /DNA_END=1949 /DNA_ORIENTATION=-